MKSLKRLRRNGLGNMGNLTFAGNFVVNKIIFKCQRDCLILYFNQREMRNRTYFLKIAGFGNKSSRVSVRAVLRGFLFGAGLPFYNERNSKA